MSEHGPMPRSAWIFPALAVLLFAAVTAARLHLRAIGRRAAVRGRAAGHPVRHGVRGRPSCRGDRRADRRALWHAAADAVGHHHRGRADRDHHARRQGGADAGARHGVRGGHDRVQRPCRHLHSASAACVIASRTFRFPAPICICRCWRCSRPSRWCCRTTP